MKVSKAATLGAALILLGHAVTGCGSDSSDGTGGTAGTAGTAGAGGDGQGATSQGGNSQGGDSSGGNDVAGNGGSLSEGGAGVGGDGQGGAGGNVGQGGSGGNGLECIGCAEYVTSCLDPAPPPRCGNDFCAGSTDIYDALADCVCTECAAECELTCTGQGADNECGACQQGSIADGCSPEFADCANDA